MKLVFHPPSHFERASANGTYRLLPFRFMRWHGGDVLLTNEVGEFIFLATDVFSAFVEQRLNHAHPAYTDLKAKHFLHDSPSIVPLQLLATKYRTKKSFLEGFTSLHMFVVTLRCDHSCPYCQVSRVNEDRTRFDMSVQTAARSIDLMFQSPSPTLKIEFQGGESLLNFNLIKWVVSHVLERNATEGRDIQFVIATNLAPLTDEILVFCREHSIGLSTSLDGPEFLHNRNRPRPGGDSHQLAVANLRKARTALGHDRVSALMTTTEASLQYPREIIDEYVAQGFDSIFLRALSPYGFAVRSRMAFRYEAAQFVDFYNTSLNYIIELNRRGTPLVEVYTQILLQKMLTPFATGYVDLQSPTGAGIAAVVYNYDGDVYASDESRMLAEMGDTSFRLGNVHQDSYASIFGGARLRAIVEGSCLETLPGCSECAFAPYCGADPILNWATQGDPIGHRPTSAFCAKQMAVFRRLFELIRNGDAFTRELLVRWATQVDAREEAVA